MRDIETMREIERAMKLGSGLAIRHVAPNGVYYWTVDNVMYSGQVVQDMINDGWLQPQNGDERILEAKP